MTDRGDEGNEGGVDPGPAADKSRVAGGRRLVAHLVDHARRELGSGVAALREEGLPAVGRGAGRIPAAVRSAAMAARSPATARDRWSTRTGEFGPEYYAREGPNHVSKALYEVVDARVDHDARILEVGCGGGRHMALLYHAGFEDLHGVDVNERAPAAIGEHFPELAAAAEVTVGAVEDVVGTFGDDAFDVAYAAETLSLIHPADEWVFGEIARVTGDYLVVVEPEWDGGVDVVEADGRDVVEYYRDYRSVFADHGLVVEESRSLFRNELLVFRHDDRE